MMILCALAWSGEVWGVDHLPISGKSVNIAAQGRLGGAFNWDDKTEVLQFNGIPNIISFSYSSSSNSASWADWYVAVSTDGSDFSNVIWSVTDTKSGSGSITLSEIITDFNTRCGIRYVMFCYSGNFGGNFTNISISEHPLTYSLDKNEELIDFGTKTKGQEHTSTVTLTHINASSNTTVSYDDKTNFSVSYDFTTGRDYWGKDDITITYKNQKVGYHETTITITDGKHPQTVTVSGTTQTTYYGKAVAAHSIGGNAYVTFNQSASSTASTTEATVNTTTSENSASSKAYYRAVPSTGYGFKGWIKGTGDYSPSAEESGDLSFAPDITYNKESSNNPSTTIYKACFGPAFNFSAETASSNSNYGTATVKIGEGNPSTSVTKQIVGDLGEENDTKTETVTFTAKEVSGCIFLGWYTTSDCSGSPVSEAKSYEVELGSTVSTPGSLKLWALFKKKQNLQWKSGLDFNLVLNATVESPAMVTAGGKTITYSSNTGTEGAVTINGNTLKAERLGKSTITASVPGDADYNAESITAEFTVDEVKQATFRPSWSGDQTTIELGMSKTIELLNIATDNTFTISANPTGKISWEREGNILTIKGKVLGTTTLTLTQVGNTFLNGNTADYIIEVTKHPNTFALNANSKAMKVGEKWEDVVENWGLGKDNTNVTSSNSKVATFDKTNNRITALEEGTATITFTQNGDNDNAGMTKTVTVTVSKISNKDVVIKLPTLTVDVDGTIEPSVENCYEDNDNTVNPIAVSIDSYTVTSSPSLRNPLSSDKVVVFENGVIKAMNAGTATITLYQPASTKYEASRNFTFDITVSKISNALTVTLDGAQRTTKNVAHNTGITLGYSSDYDSNGAFQVTLTSGSDAIATLGDNTVIDGVNTRIITSGSTAEGTNVWTITQAETYKYEGATAIVRIRVNSVPETDSFLHTSLTSDNHSWFTGGGDDYEVSVDYIPKEIRFNAWHTKGGVDESIKVTWKDVNGKVLGSKKFSMSSDSQQYAAENLPENARKFTFTATGSLSQYISDVYVVRKTYINASADIKNFGSVYTDQRRTATIKVEWGSSNGGDIKIESNDPDHFSPSPSTITGTENSNGTKTITITYTPNPNKEGQEDEATISISDKYNAAKDIKIKGTAQKYEPEIARGSNTETSMKVDASIDNVFAFTGTSATAPSANSSDDFYYTITHTLDGGVHSDGGVISYNPQANIITGLNAGTATLTIYQKANNISSATSESFEFTVSRLENRVNISLSSTTLNVDDEATVQLQNGESDGALSVSITNGSYTYSTQNRDGGGVLTYNENTKKLTGYNAGTADVTITQEQTYKYEGATKQFTVTVNRMEQTFGWDYPDLETTLQLGTVVTNNTASSNITELTDVTYKSGNTSVIKIENEDINSGKFTAIGKGSSTITATQAGNYKYLPAIVTREFTVYNKKTPAFNADSHFSGSTGRIELTCTATITVTGVSTGEDFTVTYGNKEGEAPEPVISVTQSGETITITALRIGNATLTLKQEGNDDFIAKTQTYNIEVFWPDYFLSLASTTAPTHAAGNYKKIFFTRSLKKGYSTIALPFTTTVAALTGRTANADDWVAQLSAVTKSAADGYTLYFQKVEGGTITANQPYILHLGSAVENPTWTDMTDGITVVAATAGENTAQTGYSDFSDWVMKANYSPNCDMEGKYGVVNGEGVLKKGSTGSTLKAFHAYIEGPTSVQVKAAYLDEDEADGILELFNSQENQDGVKLIYDLQGRRLPRAQAGINIVIRDGKVRKEIEPRR